ncbi:dihydropteroate synthase [Gloeothece citriformis PCC 7424]|uniref:Dihydropteroate synthase n=1 Tax=Gloeothece citriformis (strain PCC 7424) TaxID=65393 RepID=B7KL09_GLOC7|nr:dihydropteroate synthase [Gloeothece citriformis]ACK72381.1 dihydropteroate synthase [Gloeothece citriformis PCC 7424]
MDDLVIRGYSFNWGTRTYLMGILNVTPDSFSDGGEFNSLELALIQAKKMVTEGADIIDIGGQSTRPGAEQISLDEELNRVIPVIKALRSEISLPISIDTTRATVAQCAIEAGADMVNDISGGTFEPEMFSVVARLDVPIILMHIRGTPQTMQSLTDYQDLIAEIQHFLKGQINQALAVGVKRSHIIIDPGIGFAKTYEQNLQLLRQIVEFKSLDVPILVGASRKRFIGHILGENDPKQRVWGTAAACCAAIASKADILRVHDVKPMYDVCRVADAIWRTP